MISSSGTDRFEADPALPALRSYVDQAFRKVAGHKRWIASELVSKVERASAIEMRHMIGSAGVMHPLENQLKPHLATAIFGDEQIGISRHACDHPPTPTEERSKPAIPDRSRAVADGKLDCAILPKMVGEFPCVAKSFVMHNRNNLRSRVFAWPWNGR
jgi:hypothetical protein